MKKFILLGLTSFLSLSSAQAGYSFNCDLPALGDRCDLPSGDRACISLGIPSLENTEEIYARPVEANWSKSYYKGAQLVDDGDIVLRFEGNESYLNPTGKGALTVRIPLAEAGEMALGKTFYAEFTLENDDTLGSVPTTEGVCRALRAL